MHLVPTDRTRPAVARHADPDAGRPRRRGVHHRPRTDRSLPVRRFLNGLGAYPIELARSIGRGWNRFVFSPSDPTPLGLIRVAVGALLTWSLFVYGLDLQAFLGRGGWMNLDVVEYFRHVQMPYSWSFWTYVPDAFLRPVWVACLACLIAFTLGLWSRIDGGPRLGDRRSRRRAGRRSAFTGSMTSSRPGPSTWPSRGRAGRRSRSTGSSPGGSEIGRIWPSDGRTGAGLPLRACRRPPSRPTSGSG